VQHGAAYASQGNWSHEKFPIFGQNQPIFAGGFSSKKPFRSSEEIPHVLWRPMAKRQVLNFHGAEITWSCDWAPGEAA
jgi:hypothetical protein